MSDTFTHTSWKTISLSVISVILGIFAGPMLETIAPWLFSTDNLIFFSLFLQIALFFTAVFYIISAWEGASKNLAGIYQKLSFLTKSLDSRFTYIPSVRGIPLDGYVRMAEAIKSAQHEILILDAGIKREIGQVVDFDNEIASSFERKMYFSELKHKVLEASQRKLKFRRIIQLPPEEHPLCTGDYLTDEHYKQLTFIGETHPEYACLKRSPIFFNNTTIAIDRRYIFIIISAVDPDAKTYYTKEIFLFDDTSQKLVDEFIRFFERVEAHSSLVKIGECGNHQSITESDKSRIHSSCQPE